jgi:putative oxidoreductase
MFDALMKNTVAPLILRACLAAVFIFHGSQKVQQEGGTNWDKKPDESQQPDESQRLAKPVQAAVAWGELLGGIAMALGFLTRLAAIGIAAIMAGAMATVTWAHGFDGTKGGCEYNIVIIGICAVLLLTGPGNLAVDRVWRLRRKKT